MLPDGRVETLDAAYTLNEEKTAITSVTFESNGLSPIAVGYTVDFEYTDPETGITKTYSFPGRGEYRLTDILDALEVEYSSIENVSLELTEAVGETDDTALYLMGDAETGYILQSDVAFDDTYTLMVVADGTTHVIKVTDASAPKVTINFYEVDGATLDTSANIGAYNYMVLFDSWGGGVQGVTSISVNNGVLSAEFGDSVTIDDNFLD